MTLILDPWDRILQDPGFQSLKHADKQTIASNYFDKELASDSTFQALRSDQKARVRQNFLATLGPTPEEPDDEVGEIRNFFNSAYNAGVQTVADYYALVGDYEGGEAFAQQHLAQTTGGVGEFAGGVLGGIAPTGLALIGGPFTAWAVMAHYGLQSAGGARREVERYRRENPEASVDPFEELAVTVGAGAIGMGFSALGFTQFLRPAMRNTTPAIVRKLGMNLIAGKTPPVVRAIVQMAAGEGLEEGAQEAATNALMRLFVNPEQAITENVGMAALGGALGGGFLSFGRLLPKYSRGLREDRLIFEKARQEIDNIASDFITTKAIDGMEQRFRQTGDRTILEDIQRHMSQVKFYKTIFGADPEEQPETAVDQEVLLLPQFTATAQEAVARQLGPMQVPLLAEGAQRTTPLLAPIPPADIQGEWSTIYDFDAAREPVDAQSSGPPLAVPDTRIILTPGGKAAQWTSNEAIDLALDAANAAAGRVEAYFNRGLEPKKTLAAYDEAMAELHTQWTMANPGDVTGEGLLFLLNERSKGRDIRPRRYASDEQRAQRAETRAEQRALRRKVQKLERSVLRPIEAQKKRSSLIGKTTVSTMTVGELGRYQNYLEALRARRERRQALEAEPAAEDDLGPRREGTEARPRRIPPGVTGQDLALAQQEKISPEEAVRRRRELNRDVVEANRTELEQGGKPFRIEQAPDVEMAELQRIADAIGVDVNELRMSDLDTRRTFTPDDQGEVSREHENNEEGSLEFQARYGDITEAGYNVNGLAMLSRAERHRREPTILQRQRLTSLLVKNGFFGKVHWTGGQIVGPDGQRKNAVVNTATGEVWFSQDIEFGTIGHEATHRLIELLGKDHPLVQAGFEIAQTVRGADPKKSWPSDEEILSDLVGQYFEGKQAATSRSTWARFVNWLQDLWIAAKQKFGLRLLNQDVIHALNARLATSVTADLALEPRAAAKHLNDIYYRGQSDLTESRRSGTFAYQDADTPITRFHVNIERNEVLRELDYSIDSVTEEDLGVARLTADQLRMKALDILMKPNSLARIQREFGRGGGRLSIHGLLALRVKANLRFKKIFNEIAQEESKAQQPNMRPNDVRLEMLQEELNKELRLLGDLGRFAGRTLQSMNIHAGPQTVMKAVQQLERELSKAEMTQLNEMLDRGSINDPVVVQNFVNQLGPSTLTDQFWELVLNGWLSGIPTHLVNVGNNAVWLSFQVPDRVLAGTIDRGLTAVGKSDNLAAKALQYVFPTLRGRERQVFAEEVVPFLTGLKKGRQEAKETGLVWEVLKGKRLPDVASKFAIDMGSARRAWARAESATGMGIRKRLAPAVSLPGNALFAMDVYFRTLAFDAQLNALAYREARKTGKPMRDILAHPSKKMLDQARDFAAMATFNDRPGATARFIMHWRDRLPFQAGRLVVPFVNTLTNIFKRGIEMTPVVGAVANRQRLKALDAELLARQLEGTVLGAVLMLVFSPDDITTEVPESPTARANFYQQGKIPYALKMPSWMPGIGGTWVSYNRVEPFNTVLSMIATTWQTVANPEIDEDDSRVTATMMQLADGLWENLIASTYADNVQRLFRPNIGEGAKRTLERIPASLVPYSSFWRSLHRAYEARFASIGGPEEAVVRQRVGWVSELAQVVPFGAAIFDEDQRGLPRIDAFGEVITIPGDAFRQWLPIKWSTPELDPVEQELARIDAMPGLPSRSWTIRGEKVEMPEEQFYEYAMAYGKRTKEALARLIESPGYQRLTDEQKLKKIDSVTRRAHSVMRARGRRELLRSRR
jgi:hypothetical protein